MSTIHVGASALNISLSVAAYLALSALSFVLSAAETSYSSLRVTLVRLWAAKGNRKAQKVLGLINNLPHTINAIVIGDNLVNIVFTSIATFSGYAYAGALGAVLVSLANILVVFVVSEAWPKTLAANNPEETALRLSGFMALYMEVMDLPAKLFSKIGHTLSSVFHWNRKRENITTEERMIYTLELAKLEGVITDKQHDIISRLLKLDDLPASSIMVPAENAVVLRAGTTVKGAMEVFANSGHRRLPIVKQTQGLDGYALGSVVGALSIRDATILYLKGYGDTPVEDACEPVVAVSEETKLIEVLRLMHEKGATVACVEDKTRVKGFIFMNDLLESIFGETKAQKKPAAKPKGAQRTETHGSKF